jgi:hypothetical protein
MLCYHVDALEVSIDPAACSPSELERIIKAQSWCIEMRQVEPGASDAPS